MGNCQRVALWLRFLRISLAIVHNTLVSWCWPVLYFIYLYNIMKILETSCTCIKCVMCFRACSAEAYGLSISSENTSGTMRARLQDLSHGAGSGRRDSLWSGAVHQVWDACPAEFYYQTEGRGGQGGAEAQKQIQVSAVYHWEAAPVFTRRLHLYVTSTFPSSYQSVDFQTKFNQSRLRLS